MNKILGILAILLGANMFFSLSPFPDESVATTYVTGSNLIYYFTLLVIPLGLVTGGIAYFFAKSWSRIALAISFAWLFVMHAWAFYIHMAKSSVIPLEIWFKSELTLLFLGGLVLYAVLAILVMVLSRGWPKSNKSFKADAVNGAA